MTKVVLICFSILAALGLHQLPSVQAQYSDMSGSSSGLQGLISGIITAATDTVINSLETSDLCINSIRGLVQNAHQTFSSNAFTENTISFHDTGLGASLRIMKTAYLDAIPPLLDTLQTREERIDDMISETKRVRTQLERSLREIKALGARCLTPILANEIINTIYRCALLPMNNVVTEMRVTQEEVRKAFEQLNLYVIRRRLCMSRPPMEAVPCAQVMINEIPMFIEGINRGFSVPVSVHQYMVPINECMFDMRERIKVACPLL